MIKQTIKQIVLNIIKLSSKPCSTKPVKPVTAPLLAAEIEYNLNIRIANLLQGPLAHRANWQHTGIRTFL